MEMAFNLVAIKDNFYHEPLGDGKIYKSMPSSYLGVL